MARIYLVRVSGFILDLNGSLNWIIDWTFGTGHRSSKDQFLFLAISSRCTPCAFWEQKFVFVDNALLGQILVKFIYTVKKSCQNVKMTEVQTDKYQLFYKAKQCAFFFYRAWLRSDQNSLLVKHQTDNTIGL